LANTLKLFRNGAVGFIDWLDFFSLFQNNLCANRPCTSRADTLDDNFTILFELDWMNHTKIRFLAGMTPSVFDDGLLLH